MLPFKSSLRFGDSGPQITDIKTFLISHGFGKVYMKDKMDNIYIGELDNDNDEFTEILQECINCFKAKVIDSTTNIVMAHEKWIEDQYSIQVNGIFDYNTWLIMEYYDQLAEWYKANPVPEPVEEQKPTPLYEVPLIEKIKSKCIEIEKSQIGVHEIDYSNRGNKVNEFQLVGSNGEIKTGGSPWCAYFQQWAWIKSCESLGLEYKDNYSGYTPYLINWGKQNHICIGGASGGGQVSISEIESGDWGFIYSSTRDNACHIFMIIEVNKNDVITLEGNSNNIGSQDGGCVCKRRRPIKQIWAVVKWWKLYSNL
jgi:hypothetical protein